MAEITDKSTSDSGMDNDDDDDEQSWIPLPQSTRSPNSTVPTPTQTPVANAQRTTKSTSSSSSSTSSSSSSSTKTASRGMTIQRRLETRVQLKSGLVDHPLDMFWKRFLWNAAVQLWTLEWQIRVGMGMVATGTCIKIFMMSTWYFWYPKMVLVSTLFVVAAIYLDMFQLHHMLDTLGKMLLHPDNIIPLLQRLDATGLRRLTLVFLLVPTWLEMKTLSFLSGIQAETNSLPYVIALSTLLLSSMLYWYRTMHTKPRECLYRGLVILYGVSLAISAYHLNLSRLPTLAAPFLSATGTLLITYQDNDMEWISRVLRHTLRLTLRDVLSSMSTKVSEDEMLQLAMLRWIADYWASMPGTTEQKPSASPPKNTTPSQGTNHHATSSNVPAPSTMGGHTSSESATAVPPQKQESLAPTGPSNVMPKKRLSASETLQRQNQVTWEELLPMLSIATDHMSSEIKELQPDSKPPGASKPIPSRPAPTAQNSAPSTQSVDNFRDMLLSLNVDERGAPAVQAYKKAVESFPPSRETACILSLRRCPAFLSVVLHILLGRPSFVLTTIVLLPFILLEYYRMVDWIKNCEQMKQMFGVDTTNKTTSSPFVPSALLDADPMVILLSGDSYDASHPPALLLVWNNMKGSVAALQVGLSAARCAQTTAVAVQFAGNVMSLLEFGQEIHQHGLWHGLAVMAKEAILLHTCSNDQPGGAKYTQAAMGAVQNAQRVINNVQTLAADEHVGRYVQPIAWVLTSLSGHGWLWTHQDNGDERKEESNSQPDVSSEENIPKGKASGNSSYQQGIVKNTNAVGPTVDNVVQDSGAVGVASVLDEIADSYGNRLISEVRNDYLMSMYNQTYSHCFLLLLLKDGEERAVGKAITSGHEGAFGADFNTKDFRRVHCTKQNCCAEINEPNFKSRKAKSEFECGYGIDIGRILSRPH